jgi:hypothetical protein
MLAKIAQLSNTVKHLKVKQIRYQLQYRINKAGNLASYKQPFELGKVNFLHFKELPPVYLTAQADGTFVFLNLKVNFGSSIDWSYDKYGKLWNYNLQYANYLLQEDIALTIRVEWLSSLHTWLESGRIPLEPYPASLRTINTIRLLSKEKLHDEAVLSALHAELNFLYRRPEYHLLGNHLLENAFALMMGGAFFSKEQWIAKAQHLLTEELEEQVLADGAHFELSPMYHQIILFRLLELLDWYSKWEMQQPVFRNFLQEKAAQMVSWLQNMTFRNGDIAHFNDSAPGIAFSSEYLLYYAKNLQVAPHETLELGNSGYRKFNSSIYECIVDVAEIGPSYQPGHGHSDALSFIIYAHNKPVFVEWGTSTYQPGKGRSLERSSAAHNTLVIDGKNQSEVWGAFRVANRAKVKITEDNKTTLRASHDGYHKKGVTHSGEFNFKENSIKITDVVEGSETGHEKKVYFHIHPDCDVKHMDKSLLINNVIQVQFEGLWK